MVEVDMDYTNRSTESQACTSSQIKHAHLWAKHPTTLNGSVSVLLRTQSGFDATATSQYRLGVSSKQAITKQRKQLAIHALPHLAKLLANAKVRVNRIKRAYIRPGLLAHVRVAFILGNKGLQALSVYSD